MDPRPCWWSPRIPGPPRARGDGPSIRAWTSATTPPPPRSRGWTPAAALSGRQIPASPALAGMDLQSRKKGLTTHCFPRARGDGPPAPGRKGHTTQLPPRSRGWTLTNGRIEQPRMASPALAGMDPAAASSGIQSRSFPRARGDGPVSARAADPLLMLPPRSRGWTCGLEPVEHDGVASPALAGMDP